MSRKTGKAHASSRRRAGTRVSRSAPRIAAKKIRAKRAATASAGSPTPTLLDSRLKEAARIAFHMMGED
jgi:hypothetical protein